MNDIVLAKFGQRVKSIRQSKNLSQEALADLAGLHRTYIGMVERAEKNISLKNIHKIAEALDISVSELMEKI